MLNEVKEKIIALIRALGQQHQRGQVLRMNCSPREIYRELDLKLGKTGISDSDLVRLIDGVLERSVQTDHRFFMNQMFGKQQQMARLGDILTVLLNTSMYTYEVAPVLTLIEKECIERLCSLVWNSRGPHNGVFTPGSSISNMMGMMLARNNKFPDSGENGIFDSPRFSIFVSDQLHYSFIKGALFLSIGKKTIVKVRSDSAGKIDCAALQEAIESETRNGHIPLMLIGIAGTTISGVYDDLEILAGIVKKHNMWFHVDAAYGGSLLFSSEEKNRLKGIEAADSISWSLHKMMGTPLSCAVFLTKKSEILRESFSMSADYLFHGNAMDLGPISLQCGRRADALKLWLTWKSQGDAGMAKRVNALQEVAQNFAKRIQENDNLVLLCNPESPIICFRYTQPGLNIEALNLLNKEIRDTLFNEGHLLFNYAAYKGIVYLRCVLSDPEMDIRSIILILDKICATGNRITKQSREVVAFLPLPEVRG